MSLHAEIHTAYPEATVCGRWSRRLLLITLLAGSTAAQAAQPLSDQELNRGYLAYSALDNAVLVLAQGLPTAKPPQLLPRTLRLIDLENTDNLLLWQDRQSLAVGANLGLQDTSRQVLSVQPLASFGSEQFSYRWAGNLDQVIDIAKIPNFVLYGVITNIGYYNLSGEVRVRSQIF